MCNIELVCRVCLFSDLLIIITFIGYLIDFVLGARPPTFHLFSQVLLSPLSAADFAYLGIGLKEEVSPLGRIHVRTWAREGRGSAWPLTMCELGLRVVSFGLIVFNACSGA